MLPPLSLPLPWSRMRVVLALTRAVLSPKHSCGLSSRQADHAAALIVQAFLSALEDDGLEPGGGAERLQPPVRVVAVPGLDPGDSSCEAGLMLDLPVPVAAAAQLLPAGPGLLALFDAPLDVPQADGGSGGADDALAKHRAPLVLSSSGSGGDEAWSAAGAAVQQLLQLAEVLQGLGVKVVACQRGIHPAMQQALAQRGLLPLARLSALHAAHLAQLSGCLPISSHTLPPATLRRCLGALGGVQQRQMGAKQWLLLLPPAAGPPAGRPVGPVQTLLLGAGSQAAADELKVTAESALRVLAWGLHTPMVMPGGGCAEFLMARIIRTAARAAVPRPSAVQAAAYEAFAAALEHAGAALLGGAAPRAEATAAMRSALDATLRQAAQQGPEDSGAAAPQLQYLGWHAEAQQIVPVLSCKPSSGRSAGATPGAAAGGWQVEEALLADLTLAKMCALATAVEAAIAVIRLDGALLPATSGLG